MSEPTAAEWLADADVALGTRSGMWVLRWDPSLESYFAGHVDRDWRCRRYVGWAARATSTVAMLEERLGFPLPGRVREVLAARRAVGRYDDSPPRHDDDLLPLGEHSVEELAPAGADQRPTPTSPVTFPSTGQPGATYGELEAADPPLWTFDVGPHRLELLAVDTSPDGTPVGQRWWGVQYRYRHNEELLFSAADEPEQLVVGFDPRSDPGKIRRALAKAVVQAEASEHWVEDRDGRLDRVASPSQTAWLDSPAVEEMLAVADMDEPDDCPLSAASDGHASGGERFVEPVDDGIAL